MSQISHKAYSSKIYFVFLKFKHKRISYILLDNWQHCCHFKETVPYKCSLLELEESLEIVWFRGQQTFSIKGQTVNILGLVGHRGSLSCIFLFFFFKQLLKDAKKITQSLQAEQKQAVVWIWLSPGSGQHLRFCMGLKCFFKNKTWRLHHLCLICLEP